MKALVLNEVKQPLVLQERPSPKAGKDQIIVKLKAAALSLAGLTVYRALFKQGRTDLRKVFWKQLHLVGSTMGSPGDFAAMLDMVGKHEIRPVVDEVFDLSEGKKVFEKMNVSSQFVKLVLRVSDK